MDILYNNKLIVSLCIGLFISTLYYNFNKITDDKNNKYKDYTVLIFFLVSMFMYGLLYNTEENTVFMIHPRSAGNHAPGKGNGENIRINNIIKYTELENIKDWRRILSTYYESPFTLDGMRWNTIEHYLQGVKFKNTNPEHY